MYKILIEGKPIPKQRPRSSHKNGVFRTYSPQKSETKAVKKIIKSQWKGEPLSGAVSLKITCFMPIPKSSSKKEKERLLFTFHIKRPDLDNLEKFYKDAMNGIVYHDDSQVAFVTKQKIYGTHPKIEIDIEEIT
jgi:Holliday junction resolvase RusA-like endonuclease